MNTDKLRGKIVEQRLTQEKLAAAIGINPATLYKKMSGVSDFTRNEIECIRAVLALSDNDVLDIFFAE